MIEIPSDTIDEYSTPIIPKALGNKILARTIAITSLKSDKIVALTG